MEPHTVVSITKIKDQIKRPSINLHLLVAILFGLLALVFISHFRSTQNQLLVHPNGAIVKTSNNSTYFMVSDNHLLPMSLAALQTRGYTQADILQATSGDKKLKIGQPLPLATGIFYKNNNKVYLVDQVDGVYVKRLVPNPDRLSKLGYSKDEIWYLTTADKSAIPERNGPDFVNTDRHPNGTLIKDGSQLLLVNDNHIQLVSSKAILASNGLAHWPPKAATAADLRLPRMQDLSWRAGTVIKSGTDYYIIDANGEKVIKHKINNTYVLPNLGYNSNIIINAPTNTLPAKNGDGFPAAVGTLTQVVVTLKDNVNSKQIAQQYALKYKAQIGYLFGNWFTLTVPGDKISSIQNSYQVQKVQGVAQLATIYCEAIICPPVTPSPSPAPAPLPSSSTPPAPNLPPAPRIDPLPNIPYDDFLPGITGTFQVDQTVKADPGRWAGADSFAYQWRSCNSSSICNDITGATSQSFSITADLAGYMLQVAVTAANAGGSTTAYSLNSPTIISAPVVSLPPSPSPSSIPAPTGSVKPPMISPPKNTPYDEALPTTSGQAQVGQVLTVSSDGIWSGSPTSYSYQWRYCYVNCFDIFGATNKNYLITADKLGYSIQIAVTATNAGGSTTAYSLGTSSVSPQPAPPTNQIVLRPYNVSLPKITGTIAVGTTISTSSGSWNTSITFYNYQWQWCFAGNGPYPDGIRCYDIANANLPSYTIDQSVIGKLLRVKVTGSNTAGSANAYSLMTAVVPVPSANNSTGNQQPATGLVEKIPPSINGSATIGSILYLDRGQFDGAQSFTYQWQRCTSTNTSNVDAPSCKNIIGATGQTYSLTLADLNYAIRVQEWVTAGPQNGIGLSVAYYTNTTALVKSLSANSKPLISISLNPSKNAIFGTKVAISWSVLGADSCDASDSPAGSGWKWPAPKAPTPGNHTEFSTFNLVVNTTFILTCTNANGSASSQASINVVPPSVPPNLSRIGWSPTSPGAPIAVIDTGVGASTKTNLQKGYTCSGGNDNTATNPPTIDNVGHGSTVASVINTLEPGTPIIPIKVTDSGAGITDADIACAIDKAVLAGAKVINMSFAFVASGNPDSFWSGGCDTDIMHSRICAAASTAVMVAAGGNTPQGATDIEHQAPASYPEVIAATAYTDSDGQPGGNGPDLSLTQSNCGDLGLSKALDDYSAPYSAWINSGDISRSYAAPGCWFNEAGTSFAAPVVSAIVSHLGHLPSQGSEVVRPLPNPDGSTNTHIYGNAIRWQ